MTGIVGVRYDEIPIGPMFGAFLASLAGEFAGLAVDATEENVQARMAAPTGEKSEFPVGAWPTVTYSSALEEMQ